MAPETKSNRVRLDKWLWAARCFKTRALAVEAIEGGRVQVNGERVKRSKLIQTGDAVRIRQGPTEQLLIVRGLSERRGPASVAAGLYQETAESRAAREALAVQLKSVHSIFQQENTRPTKRDRRELLRFKKGEE